GDYLFRWGGDEFAAVLVDEAEHLTRATVERLQDAVARVEVRGHPLRIDVGWAEAPTDGHDAVTLLKVADERMYANKRGAWSPACRAPACAPWRPRVRCGTGPQLDAFRSRWPRTFMRVPPPSMLHQVPERLRE